ncbi:GNAT family N-acetyltransferase [Vulcanisaeta souniana]|uniref:N-acetyltransferase n=1 Tax=Vulcanisaeta souniana JCM 11219 TaxID=1293586 RepID=A0A830EF64_9CREN|nr:GNAT family N-acetyltransferase [Vulcanisaeta souniana]BDR93405.1 N-acetyltransferase [Vulcanisaeta souniana JCM 11219]GGI76887.1 N-acetyltransferase [Vulcanisaeta souniana JCM 11219]
MDCDGSITVLIGSKELMGSAEQILRDFFGSAYRYARAVVDYGVGSVALAIVNGSSVGAAVYYGINVGSVRLCIIYYIAVAEKCRGLGIGKILMSTIEEICADSDVYIATTWLGNEPADKLYKSLGYVGYTWGELRRLIGRRAVDRLLRATCGYDDDVAYVKPVVNDSDVLSTLKRIAEGDGDINRLWRETCIGVWLRLRGNTH